MIVELRLRVCPVCGHTVDVRNDLSGKRGCFGPTEAGHRRSERVDVTLSLDLTVPATAAELSTAAQLRIGST